MTGYGNMKRLAIWLLTLTLLVGCVHYDEEIWLNRDGSGKAEIRLVHRSNYAQTDYIDRLASRPGISLLEQTTRQIGPNIEYKVKFKFSSIEALNNLNDRIGMADFAGKIILTKDKDRKIHFSRQISYSGEEGDDDFSMIYRMRNLPDPVWSYKIHLPWKILNTDPAAKQDENKDGAVSWSFEADNIWHKPQTMSIEMQKELPWLAILLGFFLLVMILTFLLWLVKIARRSHLLDRIRHHGH